LGLAGDAHDLHDPFADPLNPAVDGDMPVLAREGEMGMADGVDQDEEGDDRGEDEDDEGNGGVEDEEDGTDREYDEEDYEGGEDGGDGRGTRLFMEAGGLGPLP
jgi:hypothetical protein